jgi:hypothetical protein
MVGAAIWLSISWALRAWAEELIDGDRRRGPMSRDILRADKDHRSVCATMSWRLRRS